MKDKYRMGEPQIEALLQYANNIIATLRGSFLVLDKNLQVISANQAFYATFKVVEKDTIGRLLPDLGNRQWAIPKLLILLKEILPEKKAVKDYEVEHKFEQIGERAMILNACQMRVTKKIAGAIAAGIREAAAEEEEEGEEDLILLAIEDITQRKQVEEKITKLNAELEERVLQRTSELSRAVKELEAFSYSVAHDLKAPLRAMSGFSNILSEDYAPKLDDNGRRLIGVIKDNARNMGQLIDDLLKLSHLLRQELDIVDIDMTTLAQSVSRELGGELFGGRAIEVSVKPLPLARADRTLARQIFTNLISNAIKFASHKDNALIEIGGYDQGREHVYYVKDNGAGFDMKYADQLFGVFHRLHAQDEFSGTGIGLAIVSNAVRRHGGTVWAEAETDKGATFYFTLPKGGQDE
ncbi:MAG: ATP-binding protein [Elusimicrobia bacterium]|nr:ATP-binding protein [Elusimicrobiota bacterium]